MAADNETLIQLSAKTWDHDQKLAILRLAGQALTEIEHIVHDSWGRKWWTEMLDYLEITQRELGR